MNIWKTSHHLKSHYLYCLNNNKFYCPFAWNSCYDSAIQWNENETELAKLKYAKETTVL